MVVLDALAALSPRARAVVVLRYWADLSVEQVGDVLGCSTGNVKSLSARALPRLREVLDEALSEPGPPSRPPLAQHHPGGGGAGLYTSGWSVSTTVASSGPRAGPRFLFTIGLAAQHSPCRGPVQGSPVHKVVNGLVGPVAGRPSSCPQNRS